MKPLTLSRKDGLYLKHIPDKGRGVFCREPIAKDEIIEVAPVIISNENDMEHMQKTSIKDYCFKANSFSRHVYLWLNISDSSKVGCIPMGITALCNHLLDANARYEAAEDGNMPFFVLKAARDIQPDTEICINYGVSWFAMRNYAESPGEGGGKRA